MCGPWPCARGSVHTWEAGKRYKIFVARSRDLSAPLLRRCDLVVLPHLDSCTLWSSQSAPFLVRRKTDNAVKNARGTQS